MTYDDVELYANEVEASPAMDEEAFPDSIAMHSKSALISSGSLMHCFRTVGSLAEHASSKCIRGGTSSTAGASPAASTFHLLRVKYDSDKKAKCLRCGKVRSRWLFKDPEAIGGFFSKAFNRICPKCMNENERFNLQLYFQHRLASLAGVAK